MGCDIHMHIEVKIDGSWQHYSCPDIQRNYALFAKMADVRNDGSIDPISPPRGIPDDASPLTKYAYKLDGSDGHSHSFLTAKEIAILEGWTKQYMSNRNGFVPWYDIEMEWKCYLFGNSFAGFAMYPEERPKGLEDVRFVFWFDN